MWPTHAPQTNPHWGFGEVTGTCACAPPGTPHPYPRVPLSSPRPAPLLLTVGAAGVDLRAAAGAVDQACAAQGGVGLHPAVAAARRRAVLRRQAGGRPCVCGARQRWQGKWQGLPVGTRVAEVLVVRSRGLTALVGLPESRAEGTEARRCPPGRRGGLPARAVCSSVRPALAWSRSRPPEARRGPGGGHYSPSRQVAVRPGRSPGAAPPGRCQSGLYSRIPHLQRAWQGRSRCQARVQRGSAPWRVQGRGGKGGGKPAADHSLLAGCGLP